MLGPWNPKAHSQEEWIIEFNVFSMLCEHTFWTWTGFWISACKAVHSKPLVSGLENRPIENIDSVFKLLQHNNFQPHLFLEVLLCQSFRSRTSVSSQSLDAFII